MSAVLPPSVLLFLLRGQLQGFLRVLSTKISTNQSNNYGSVHLAIFDHLRVFEIVSGRTVKRQKEEVEEFQKREERKGGNVTLILSLLTLFLICETSQFHQNITLKNY